MLKDGQEPKFFLVDDNAKYHQVWDVKDWKAENGLQDIKWPSYSTDLNIIENMLSVVEDELYDFKD